jgi:hypothetical protein
MCVFETYIFVNCDMKKCGPVGICIKIHLNPNLQVCLANHFLIESTASPGHHSLQNLFSRANLAAGSEGFERKTFRIYTRAWRSTTNYMAHVKSDCYDHIHEINVKLYTCKILLSCRYVSRK